MTHNARLDQRGPDGVCERDRLLALCKRPSERDEARRELRAPSYPSSVDYLRAWAFELHGRSGVGMSGLAPLSYATIAAWAALTDNAPEPHEVAALFRLDQVLLHPPELVQ